jgi:hypothetical protein
MYIPVRSTYSCGAAIVFEQASKSRPILNHAAALSWFIGSLWEKQFVTFPLMVPFAVVVSAEFC